jgi:hypothetical protein
MTRPPVNYHVYRQIGNWKQCTKKSVNSGPRIFLHSDSCELAAHLMIFSTYATICESHLMCAGLRLMCYKVLMTRIVGIHGIAQQFSGGYQLGTRWFDALRDGLIASGNRAKARTVRPDHLQVAFFGDLFRPSGAMAVKEPPFSAADVQPGLERELLTAFFGAAVVQDPSLGVPSESMGLGRIAVQVMLDRLASSATLAGIAQRGFIGNLKQVAAFLADSTVKHNVLARVREQISDDTRVVIGHSLGSVVAYEYLCHEQRPSVELLVTLGSPLGIPNVVFDRLTPAPARGVGTWPCGVRAWVNVADPDDIVALRKDLRPLFPGTAPHQAVADRLVDNGSQPHAVERYLNARQTGSALGDVLN